MRAKGKRLVVILCLIVAAFAGLSFSKPGRIQYHKWRVSAAKAEYRRLRAGEYSLSDTLRELFLGKPRTWTQVESTWKHHEQALVDLDYLHRIQYYARRGKVPLMGDPEFARVVLQMDKVCPCWSYTVSESTLIVTATKQGLELWKQLAPSVGLQPDKPQKNCRRKQKSSTKFFNLPDYSIPAGKL